MRLSFISIAADIAFTSLVLGLDRPPTSALAQPSIAACSSIGDARLSRIDEQGLFAHCITGGIDMSDYRVRGPNAFALKWSVERCTD